MKTNEEIKRQLEYYSHCEDCITLNATKVRELLITLTKLIQERRK